MTNEEAINWIINISADIGKSEHRDLWHYKQALYEIRDMLEDVTDKNVGDIISRQAAIEAIKEDKIDLTNPNIVAVFKTTGDYEKVETQVMTCDRHIKILKDLPSERKHGKWIKARGSWCTPGGDPVWECSECGKGVHVYGIEHGSYGSDIADGQWVSCPNCDADMREVQDD